MLENSKFTLEPKRLVLKKFDNNDPDPDKLPFEVIIIEHGIVETLKTEFEIFEFMEKEKHGTH